MKKLIFLLAFCVSVSASARESIQVVTSIKPLQLVAEAIVADLGQVEALIPPGASPHHYALKPSDIRRLHKADLVVWIGPDLEQFLSKPLARANTTKIQLLAESEAGHEEHEEAGHEDEHDHHDHGGNDPHLWMNPTEMLHAAELIMRELSKQFPQHAAALAANYQAFSTALITQDQATRVALADVKEQGFVVFHDAFSLFVERYGLNQRAYVTVDPAQAPGAKKVAKIHALLTEENVSCVFVEPQFEAAVVRRIVADLPVKLGRLDPLAVDISSEAGYVGYMASLVESFQQCLK